MADNDILAMSFLDYIFTVLNESTKYLNTNNLINTKFNFSLDSKKIEIDSSDNVVNILDLYRTMIEHHYNNIYSMFLFEEKSDVDSYYVRKCKDLLITFNFEVSDVWNIHEANYLFNIFYSMVNISYQIILEFSCINNSKYDNMYDLLTEEIDVELEIDKLVNMINTKHNLNNIISFFNDNKYIFKIMH